MRDRVAVALVATSATAIVTEVARAWPAESPGAGFIGLVVAQALVFSLLWTAPLSLLIVAARWLRSRTSTSTSSRTSTSTNTWIIWIPVVGFLQITLGAALLGWSAGAFVRQDLAAAVMPVALLGVFILIAAAAWGAHQLLRARIERLPRTAVLAVAVGGTALAAVIHLMRFPAVLDDPLIPALLQIAVVFAVGVGMPIVRPRAMRVAAVALGAVWLGAFALLLFIGRVAPLSYPVAAAAIDQRGLVASRVAPLLARLGDADGDGFGRWFGGLDCDDDDAAIHPLAGDPPGDGVDQDCFEGDLTEDAVAADRRARAEGRRPPRQRVENVLLITVDALRADALGPRGKKKKSATPNVDRLVARSTLFEEAWTQAPMTRRAFPALLAGRYPANIHWLDLQTKYPYPVSHDDNLYLAEVVRDAGIHTALSIPFNYAQNSRFDQGFAQRMVHPASKFKNDVCAPAIVDDAIRVLGERRAGRFLLWVHFYEAHHPYVVHKGFDFGDEPHERYLSEVRFIDDQVGRLLDAVASAGLAGDTAIVFTGDHGEEFGEHGGEAHGDLYPEDLRVPLVVHLPGAAPRRIAAPARIIDVAPTVLDLLGIAAPDSFDGDSLLPEVDGEPPRERLIYAELVPDRAVPRRVVSIVQHGWQLIVDFSRGSRSLHDLTRDPTAQHNLLIEAPARARELELTLRRHLALRVGPLRISRAPKGSK